MRSMRLLEWVGGLDEDLLERSELPAVVKQKPRIIPWLATAACLCLVCTLAFGFFGGGKKVAMDNAAGEVPEKEELINGNGSSLVSDKNNSFQDSENSDMIVDPYGYPCKSQSYWALHSMKEMEQWETVAFFSRQELDAWLEVHLELEGIDRQKVLQLCAEYDEDYFAKQALLLSRVAMADHYRNYESGHIYTGIGDAQTDWLLYLHEISDEVRADAEGCLYVFSEVDPNCTIEPGDTVGILLVSQQTEPKS